MVGSLSRTWEMAAAWRQYVAAGAWHAPWVSPRWMACRWELRCGQIDPGVLLYLMRTRGMDLNQLEDLLHKDSGLLGISGVSSDMRDLLPSDESGAKLAIDHFVYRLGRELGSLVAALGGLDALVFTGGIGEHASAIRARVCRDAAWLQVAVDEDANRRGEVRISPAGRVPSIWAIPTDEELMIARHTVSLVLR